MAKYLLTLIFTAAMIPVVTAQKTDALTYAESVAFALADKNTGALKNALNPKQIERPAFVFYTGDVITGLDASVELWTPFGKKPWVVFHTTDRMRKTNMFDNRAFVTFAGPCNLLLPRNGSIVEVNISGARKYEVDTVTFNFEEGKYYTINNRVDKENKIEFSIKETDIAPYLAYQKAHPNRLDGRWSGEEKRLLTTFLIQYYIDGNRMKFEGESKNPKQTLVVEGKMMYNENTIIFFPESASQKGEEIKNFNGRADRLAYVWYYTLTNNELHIEEGSPFFIGTQVWVNTGNFQKMN